MIPTWVASQYGFRTSYDESATALFDRMNVQPSYTRKGLINDAIVALKDSGVWDKLDALYLTASHDSQAGRLNWIENNYNLSTVNSPAFTVDRGYVSDGSTSYLTTGFNPATAVGANFTQDSAHEAVYCNTTTNAGFDFGNSTARLSAGSAVGTFAARVNTTTQSTGATGGTAVGHSLAYRDDNSTQALVKNGVEVTSGAVASTSLTSTIFFALAYNNGTAAALFSTRRLAALHFGGALTSQEQEDIYSIINTYLTSIGAN